MNLRAAIVLFLVTSMAHAEELPVYWSKSVIGSQTNVTQRGFWVFVIGYNEGGYYAYCGFSNQTSHPVRVVGTIDESAEFRAKAALFVSATQDGPWRKVAEIVPTGHKATLLVGPHSDSEAIMIGLNELAPLIDKFAYARIRLPTGEATIFSAKELKH